ncbi:HdeD family acid-resistance protein [Xiamenia xianingshaonis]|uniref:DUF308 domain-containing protein n=1 Tax=Xiamenia xianingshaonis TaxID=2682776 RepID=A0A9E6MQU6_9ACTN|nr:DUF308 domain-containing protein [Xiamenia xianingshaonis]NGM18361.1 hypothetical protein [Eggerthellaceae bacterium zg-893]NHM15011.1 hypothetical protein [Xiamenia xianingshaonis]NHM17030.1 hypothetical protein [Xiamenia xianingshaonis]QTU84259.1 DUF308 domain-containing protein [Xiamenia xianingshaonis]
MASATKSVIDMVRSNAVVQAVLYIAFGLLLVIMPSTAALTVVYLLGIFCLISGAAALISYFRKGGAQQGSAAALAIGIFYLVAALIVFLFPRPIASVFSLVLGILLFVGGIVNMVRSFNIRSLGGNAWVVMLVISGVLTVGGILIIVNPFGATTLFVTLLGVLLVAKGASDLALERLFVTIDKR